MSSERDILDIFLRLAHQVIGDIEPGMSARENLVTDGYDFFVLPYLIIRCRG
jgi:hypothetical protein